MIEARNLTKRYGETTAVNDLTFTVKPGIVTGFLGPNGSGKSTTMRLILGLDAPSEGEVTVMFEDPHELIRLVDNPGADDSKSVLKAQGEDVLAPLFEEGLYRAGLDRVHAELSGHAGKKHRSCQIRGPPPGRCGRALI